MNDSLKLNYNPKEEFPTFWKFVKFHPTFIFLITSIFLFITFWVWRFNVTQHRWDLILLIGVWLFSLSAQFFKMSNGYNKEYRLETDVLKIITDVRTKNVPRDTIRLENRGKFIHIHGIENHLSLRIVEIIPSHVLDIEKWRFNSPPEISPH